MTKSHRAIPPGDTHCQGRHNGFCQKFPAAFLLFLASLSGCVLEDQSLVQKRPLFLSVMEWCFDLDLDPTHLDFQNLKTGREPRNHPVRLQPASQHRNPSSSMTRRGELLERGFSHCYAVGISLPPSDPLFHTLHKFGSSTQDALPASFRSTEVSLLKWARSGN